MGLESLLLSRDPEVVRILQPALEKLSIGVEVCTGARSGNEIITTEHFDAVIVDCDDLQGGLEVLQELRKSGSNRNTVALAILNGTSTHAAFEKGANFVLQKPISPVSAMRCFNAALGLMARERRRYFRQPVEMPVTLYFGPELQVKTTATNLSEGGLALRYRGKLPTAAMSKVQFMIPGTPEFLEMKATLAWADDTGRAGIRFVGLSAKTCQLLERWLGEQMEKLDSWNPRSPDSNPTKTGV